MRIEDLAVSLTEYVYFDPEVWELALLGTVSARAPKININNTLRRSNMHMMMCGDISSGKSNLLNILMMIAPKFIKVSRATEASIEGASLPNGIILPGLIEQADNGLLVITEFKRSYERHNILREAMDCDLITVTKRGVTRSFVANGTFACASNPKKDFFTVGKMRGQVPFSEGIMSRFDVFLPLVNTKERTKKIVSMMRLFSSDTSDLLTNVKRELGEVSSLMELVRGINVTKKQSDLLKSTFLEKVEIDIDVDRSLVIVRDLEILCRILNTLVVSDVKNRKMTPLRYLTVTDEDIERTLSLWEYLMVMRKQLYETKTNRQFMSPQEYIIKILEEKGGMSDQRMVLEELMVAQICSQRSFYTHLNNLEEQGVISRDRKYRSAVISLNEGV